MVISSLLYRIVIIGMNCHSNPSSLLKQQTLTTQSSTMIKTNGEIITYTLMASNSWKPTQIKHHLVHPTAVNWSFQLKISAIPTLFWRISGKIRIEKNCSDFWWLVPASICTFSIRNFDFRRCQDCLNITRPETFFLVNMFWPWKWCTKYAFSLKTWSLNHFMQIKTWKLRNNIFHKN